MTGAADPDDILGTAVPPVRGRRAKISEASSSLSSAWLIVLALSLVFLNAFFVAAEFALVRVRATRVQQLVQEGNRRARVVQRVLERLDAHLSAAQVGITLASLALGWVGEPAFARLFRRALEPLAVRWELAASPFLAHSLATLVAFGLITFLHVVLGEQVPKMLAIVEAERVALWTAGPLNLFARLFYPLIALLNGSTRATLAALGLSDRVDETAHTDEEIRMLVSASAQHGYLDETERRLLDNVFEFRERIAREVMVPRQDMVCLYVEDPIEESLEVARTSGHTRFPLCEEDKDHIIGLIHIKDLFARAGQIQSLRELARPILMVPETISIADLLRRFQQERAQMAVLVDEYGGTAGLVTIEDILEEIVGDIQDEFDTDEEPELEALAPDEYEVDGAMLLDEAQEQLGFRIEEPPPVDTIGGYVLSLLGRQPAVGDRVVVDGFEAEVTETEGFRITRLRFRRLRERPQPADAEEAERPAHDGA